MKILDWVIVKDCGHIRFLSIILQWKHKSLPAWFSERNGYIKFYRIGSYRFSLRKERK